MTTPQLETLWRKVLERQGTFSNETDVWRIENGRRVYMVDGIRALPPLTLDALRGMVDGLTPGELDRFHYQLCGIVSDWTGSILGSAKKAINASAEHRCIALARTLGIKEGECS